MLFVDIEWSDFSCCQTELRSCGIIYEPSLALSESLNDTGRTEEKKKGNIIVISNQQPFVTRLYGHIVSQTSEIKPGWK